MKTLKELDAFTAGYIVAAFWTFDDDAPSGEYSTSGRPETLMAKLAPEALAKMQADCDAFQAANAELMSRSGTLEQHGHDFWLTRNHHGAGFWDRGYDDAVGNGLTAAAHKFGEQDLYEGDDGLLYV